MKIDFEVIEPRLGTDLHKYKFIKDTLSKEKETWGSEAFVIAQVEIAEFDAFPDIHEDDEGTYVRTVVGRINGQVYANTLVYHDYGINTGHPILIEHLSYKKVKYRNFLIEEIGDNVWSYIETKGKNKYEGYYLSTSEEECKRQIDDELADRAFCKSFDKLKK